MIIDADTWIGHFPFQSLPRRSAADLLRQMDRHGIDKALVGSLNGLLYKDAHEANYELRDEIKRHAGRLIGSALLNPAYYGWKDDLRQCREEFEMPVVRLTPDYHGYKLTDPAASELVAAASELKMTVALIGRMVDPRGRHRLDPGRELDRSDAAALVAKHPKGRFLMLNFSSPIGDSSRDGAACYYDIARMHGDAGHYLPEIVRKHGTDRLVFGSTMLLRTPTPAKLALDFCDLSKQKRDAVLHRNLVGLVPELRQ